jgi:hypothetical protein
VSSKGAGSGRQPGHVDFSVLAIHISTDLFIGLRGPLLEWNCYLVRMDGAGALRRI